MPASYSPREHLLRIYRRWWLIVLLALLGGAAGWLVHSVRAPVYQSSFEFAVTIDPAQTGPLAERDYDRLQHALGRVINTRDIIELTLAKAAGLGIEMDIPSFRSLTVQEWRGSVWIYSIRHPDPHTAYTLAALWGETSDAELQTALAYALEAQTIRGAIDALAACGDPALAPGAAGCERPPYEDIEGEIADLTARWEQAVFLSRGLIPAIAFELTREAGLPKEPLNAGRATLVISFAAVGMLAGFWLVDLRPPGRLPQEP